VSDDDNENVEVGFNLQPSTNPHCVECEKFFSGEYIFKGILTRHDHTKFKSAVDAFERSMAHAAKKSRQLYTGGIVLKVQTYTRDRERQYSSSAIVPPIVFRVPQTMTVWQLREKLSSIVEKFRKQAEEGEEEKDNTGENIAKVCKLSFEKDDGTRRYSSYNNSGIVDIEGHSELTEENGDEQVSALL
jgi:hypothetical protein